MERSVTIARSRKTGIVCRILMGSAAVVFVFTSIACSGGGEGEGGAVPRYDEVWIDPAETPTTRSIADLYGGATCDACPPSESLYGTCPAILGPFSSAIDVSWTNLTTGESGDAVHGIYGRRSWFFSYCTVTYSHRWYASIPLAFGPNEIELTAARPGASPGTAGVAVTRIPPAPQNLVARAGAADVVLSWDSAAGAESYDLLWSTEPDLSLPSTRVIAGVTSPYRDGGSTNAARYYAVRAVAAGYGGPLSDVVLATVGWIAETIPLPPLASTGVDLALALDSAAQAHVHVSRLGTAANPWIYDDYATNAGGSWTSLPVSDNASNLTAGVALDAADGVHVSYGVLPSRGQHAVLVGDTWVAETFDENATCYTSLALDPLEHVHVLYQQSQLEPDQKGLLRHATDAGGPWMSELVDATAFGCYQEGSKLSLCVDDAARAHALYLPGPSESGLRYANNVTGTWVPESVTASYVRSLALALDASGVPHAVWTDGSGALVHATRLGPGEWLAEAVDAFAFGPSLAMEPGGEVHVSYIQYALGELRYARLVSGSWQVLPVASGSQATTSIALDSQGSVHIVWFDGAVRYVTNR